MEIIILPQCKKEIEEFPYDVQVDLADHLSDLAGGLNPGMPISRKMKGMGQNVFELRLRERFGIFRVIYFIKKNESIYLIHGFQKKSEKTLKKNIKVSLQRIKGLL